MTQDDSPDWVTIRILGPEDAELVQDAGDEVFDAEPDAALTASFLADPRHHIVAALVDGRIVGFASAVDHIHPDKGPELCVLEVGVAERYQRRGIGRRLMAALFDHGRALGCSEAWLMTETDNAPARRLYSAVGCREETVVYYTLPLAGDPS